MRLIVPLSHCPIVAGGQMAIEQLDYLAVWCGLSGGLGVDLANDKPIVGG